MTCAFCDLVLRDEDRPLTVETDSVVAFEDAYPCAPGHILVIPRRHVSRLADLTATESGDLWQAALLLLHGAPADAFTVGINDGPAAGQTVPHVHLHLIPRSEGDVPDPRGGIRWVLPETADYWTERKAA